MAGRSPAMSRRGPWGSGPSAGSRDRALSEAPSRARSGGRGAGEAAEADAQGLLRKSGKRARGGALRRLGNVLAHAPSLLLLLALAWAPPPVAEASSGGSGSSLPSTSGSTGDKLPFGMRGGTGSTLGRVIQLQRELSYDDASMKLVSDGVPRSQEGQSQQQQQQQQREQQEQEQQEAHQEQKQQQQQLEVGSSSTEPSTQEGLHCDAEEWARLRGQFSDVVLILQFNYGGMARNLSGFWREVYGRLFMEVVFISEVEIPELGILERAPQPFGREWQNNYWALPKIMSRYPNAAGFLFTNDDVALNYWTLLGADKSKLWLTNNRQDKKDNKHWPFDVNAVVKNPERESCNETRISASTAYNLMSKKFREQYRSSAQPYPDHYQKRVCDVFFIPRKFVEPLAYELIPFFREARVHSEVAIPTMFYALDHPDNFDHSLDKMVYRWEMYDPKKREHYDPLRYWTKDIPALHPWKLSKPLARTKFIQTLSSGDPCICRDFEDLCKTAL